MQNVIKHISSPSFHPSSNDVAENAVKTIKNSFKKSIWNNYDFNQQINLLLNNVFVWLP